MYWEYIVYSQYMGGLKWKPCYKKSRALASARVPPLLHTYIGPIRWVCVFIPVDICNTVFWLAANIYGINAVAFWLEDKCVPQDALIGWKDLWIMQFCIPDAMHKQQQLCAAYKRQNSLFFFIQRSLRFLLRNLLKNPLLSDPLQLKSASMGP